MQDLALRGSADDDTVYAAAFSTEAIGPPSASPCSAEFAKMSPPTPTEEALPAWEGALPTSIAAPGTSPRSG